MNSPRQLGRRAFLRGVGGALIALPILEATHGSAWAQGRTPAKRFVVVFRHGGTLSNIYRYPADTESWRLDGTGAEQGHDYWTPLDQGEALRLGPIHSVLEEHKDQLLVITGVDSQNGLEQCPYLGDHRWANKTILTAGNAEPDGPDEVTSLSPSIDQVLAQRLSQATSVPFSSVNLMVGGHQYGTPFFSGPRQPVEGESSPDRAFATYLGAVSSGTPDPALVRQRAKGLSMLDGVIGNYRRLQPKLSTVDRRVVDAHLTHLRELEQRIERLAISTCTTPTINQSVEEGDAERVGPIMADIIVAALKCGLTQVATLNIADIITPWLGEPFGPVGYDIGHSLHHVASDIGEEGSQYPKQAEWLQEMVSNRQWCLGLFKRILEGLKAVPEGEGTMLDNTVMLYTSEFSNGSVHSVNDMPLLLAGSGAGYFRTGRHINCNLLKDHPSGLKYRSRTSTHNLYTSIVNAFGFPDEHFGNDQVVFRGPLPGLT